MRPLAPVSPGRLLLPAAELLFVTGGDGWGLGVWDAATGERLLNSEQAAAELAERVRQETEGRRAAEEQAAQEAEGRRKTAGQARRLKSPSLGCCRGRLNTGSATACRAPRP